MSSLRRILSSRANGALSRGPQTPEGKLRSCQNALRHGLLAECIVLPGESLDAFAQLLAEHIEPFDPADGVEFGMIEEMAAAYWRLRRSWAIENPSPRRLGRSSMKPAFISCISARSTTSCCRVSLARQTNLIPLPNTLNPLEARLASNCPKPLRTLRRSIPLLLPTAPKLVPGLVADVTVK